jgi:hypothetical protein
MKIPGHILSIVILVCCHLCKGQDSTSLSFKISNFPDKFFERVQGKMSSLDRMLSVKTEKYLQKLARKESKLQRKFSKIDSAAAKTLFADSRQYYDALARKLKNDTNTTAIRMTGAYQPYADSLAGTLSFLKQMSLSNSAFPGGDKAASAIKSFHQLQNKLQDAEQIKQFIRQRREQIKAVLGKYTGLPRNIENAFGQYKKDVYYYQAQIKEYKDILNDPDKLEMKTLSLLNQLPAFHEFMSKHSQLAGLFNLQGSYDAGFARGLQSRGQLASFMQDRVSAAGPNPATLLQRNIQSAQGMVDQVRDKLKAAGIGGGDLEMPDFKPSNQKTKSFFQRIELGTNLQTTRSTYFFPITTDLGLSLGYRLGDKNIFGFGTSLKLGWGKDIRHIVISAQGMDLRSFLDVSIRKTFFASAGFEYSYQQPGPIPISLTHGIENLNSWRKSGLIGLSKITSLKTKFFKKSKVQLLWDYLSYYQVPRSQPFKFRVGYNF